jgi:hypothetical protein
MRTKEEIIIYIKTWEDIPIVEEPILNAIRANVISALKWVINENI